MGKKRRGKIDWKLGHRLNVFPIAALISKLLVHIKRAKNFEDIYVYIYVALWARCKGERLQTCTAIFDIFPKIFFYNWCVNWENVAISTTKWPITCSTLSEKQREKMHRLISYYVSSRNETHVGNELLFKWNHIWENQFYTTRREHN